MAFQEARPAREPMFRSPASVIALIAALAVAHLARILAPAAISDAVLYDYALNPAFYALQGASLFHRLVPPFSSIFLHANLTHLAVNSVWLLAFGPVVARRFGGLAFYVFFFLCGLAGSALYVAMNWGVNAETIGASGAISGLMGAAIRMMDIRRPYLNVAALPLQPLWSRQVLLFTGIWLSLNFVTGYFAIGTFGAVETVAWEDHMGGYFAGLLLVGLFEHFVGPAAKLRRAGA